MSVYVTERDDWYLYGKELLEYDQYRARLHIKKYEWHKTGLGHCVVCSGFCQAVETTAKEINSTVGSSHITLSK